MNEYPEGRPYHKDEIQNFTGNHYSLRNLYFYYTPRKKVNQIRKLPSFRKSAKLLVCVV